MTTKEKVLKIVEYISLSSSIVLSIVFGILDACGLNVNYLLGFLFGSLTTYFLTCGIRESEKSKITSYTISQLDNTKVILQSIDEVDAYIAERIGQAKTSVYDFCWWDYNTEGPVIHRNPQLVKKLGADLDNSLCKFCNKGGHRIYREIFSLHSDANKQKLLEHIKIPKNYQCAHYDTSTYKFPKLQFVIIDEEEVIFASRFYPTHCIIRDKNIIDIMLNYFDQAWALAVKIRENQIDEEFLTKVRESL